MVRGNLVAAAFSLVFCFLYPAVAHASPFCFETGPGYQKCVTSGHDLTPIYQGPTIYTGGNVPWVPSPPPPVYIPVPAIVPSDSADDALDALAGEVLKDIQQTLDADPANAQFQIRVLQVLLTQTGADSCEGVARMSAGGGPQHDIPVHVYSDGGTLKWKIDPGAMAVFDPTLR